MPGNIERSGLRRGEYVGYGSGNVYRIRRAAVGNGWYALGRGGEYREARTLAALSTKL